MPAEANNAKETTRDRRGLGNDRPSQLDVIELAVSNPLACPSSSGEEESKREVGRVVRLRGDGENFNLWSAVGCNCGRSESGPRISSVDAVLNRHAVETTGDALNGETQGHILIETLRREDIKVEMAIVIITEVGETYVQIWSKWGNVYVTGRPIQAGPGVIGHCLTA